MTWHMVHFSEIGSLSVSLQFLAFSEAYFVSAGQLCSNLAAYPAESTYAKGAVVMSLTLEKLNRNFGWWNIRLIHAINRILTKEEYKESVWFYQ